MGRVRCAGLYMYCKICSICFGFGPYNEYRLHNYAVLSCVYFPYLKFYVTSGRDSYGKYRVVVIALICLTEKLIYSVKIWTEIGGLVHQFTAHTKVCSCSQCCTLAASSLSA